MEDALTALAEKLNDQAEHRWAEMDAKYVALPRKCMLA